MCVLTNAWRNPSLGAPGHVTKILQAKSGQKVEYLNQYFSVITYIDKKWLKQAWSIFFAMIRMTQTGGARLGDPPQTGPPKF